MLKLTYPAWRFSALALTCAFAFGLWSNATAQIDPPSTIFGSITDTAGTIPEGVPVEAYIGDKLCSNKATTVFTGDGAARVTAYVLDVVSDSQVPGCGTRSTVKRAEVRIKVGDRFAEQTATWEPGPVQLDVTFGGATPAVIPTFTPAPTRTPDPRGTAAPIAAQTPLNPRATIAGEVIGAGTPGAGSPVAASPVATRPGGGVTSDTPDSNQAQSNDGGGGGFPIWGVAILVLGGIAAIGGGVGYAMSRNREGGIDDDLGPPDTF